MHTVTICPHAVGSVLILQGQGYRHSGIYAHGYNMPPCCGVGIDSAGAGLSAFWYICAWLQYAPMLWVGIDSAGAGLSAFWYICAWLQYAPMLWVGIDSAGAGLSAYWYICTQLQYAPMLWGRY